MKKISLIAACCFFVNTFSFAQEFPEYGTVTFKEIDLKECSFDKEASAVILMHEAFSGYDDQHHLVTSHHVRIKILKEKGIDEANISIPYYRKDDFEVIDEVEGMTINTDANDRQVITALGRKAIYSNKTNDRIGEIVFAFPAIKVGSIIDYKYRSTMKHYGGLDDWTFQDELPVVASKYTLMIIPNAEFAYRVNKTLDIPLVVKKMESSGGVYFEMDNIPGLGNEPYIDARRDYLQRVIFQLSGIGGAGDSKKYSTSWNELNRELNMSDAFGSQLGKNLEGTEDFIKMAKLLPTPEEKMKTVYNYVRSNMNWNNLYSKYVDEGVKAAWRKKSGTSGEINLILVSLLKDAGLETYPMLVSERFHGKVNTDYPFIDQFNSVFACVDINKRRYYLDATDKAIPVQLTPSTILNTTGFIIKRKAGELVNITNDSLEYRESVIADLILAQDGSISGEVSVKSFDYARIIKLDDYKENKEKFVTHHFIVDGTSLIVKEPKIDNMQQDSLPLEQTGKLTGVLNQTGEYTFLPLNIFTGFDTNPFLAENRFSNINFGYKRTVMLNLIVHLPVNYAVDGIPKSVRLTNPDKDISFVRQVEHDKENNMVHCSMIFQFKKSLYEADMYDMVKEMYKKMFDYLKEPVILKRTN